MLLRQDASSFLVYLEHTFLGRKFVFFSVLLSKHGTLLSVSSMVDSCSDLAGLLLEEEQKEYKANLKR